MRTDRQRATRPQLARHLEARRGTAEAREVSCTPKLASYEVNIRNEADQLLACFQGMVYRKSVSIETLLAEDQAAR